MAETLFYLLSIGAIACGAGVIRARMPLFSVLCLLGAFFCLSGIYLLAGFQFLAVTQLLVYAGAIMVLFLFVIMLLNLGDENEIARQSGIALSGKQLAVAGTSAGVFALIGVLTAGYGIAPVETASTRASGIDELQTLAVELFSRYMLPFEAASLLLLLTMIGVIAIAKRQRAGEPTHTGAGFPWTKEPLDEESTL